MFLANSAPHFISGVTGRSFPTPFATPPFRGQSSPLVNVAWSLVNLALAWLLLVVVAELDLRHVDQVAAVAVGFAGMAALAARSAAKVS